MTDLVRRSLDYFLAQPADAQWSDFLLVLGETLSEQMGVPEVRAFFSVLGRRIARRQPLPAGLSISGLQQAINQHHSARNWGFVEIADAAAALEFTHACGPFRKAFGDEAMAFAPALFEGLYAEWLAQQGAGAELKLQQVGGANAPLDVLRFRLTA